MAPFSRTSFTQRVEKFRQGLQQAFAVRTVEEPFTLDDLNLLARVADAVIARRMATPAVLFLESMGPLSFLGSQALHFFTPILELAFTTKEIEQVAHLLERRHTVSRLVTLIEAKSAPQGASAR